MLKTKKDLLNFSKIIKENLKSIIENIIANPKQIKIKGVKALSKIKEKHNPKLYAQQLELIYKKCNDSKIS